VLFLEGIEDRNQAETLIKAIMLVNQDLDELPTEPDAWFDQQLVGLSVLRDGVEVGSIIRVEHYPAQDMLIVGTKDEKEVMVPFVKAFVSTVDIEAKIITVTPPAGLFEEIED
jgi:16S rRNA processing protein RimM